MPGRAPGQSRTEDPALPAAAHRRPAGPRTTQTQDQDPGELALGPGTRSLLPGHLGATGADLSQTCSPTVPDSIPGPARGTGARPSDTGRPRHDHPPETRSGTEAKITKPQSGSDPATLANDQGQHHRPANHLDRPVFDRFT